jgi:hypothetical protein
VDKKWMLFGMIFGTIAGAFISFLPEPAQSYSTWIACGSMIGLVIPLLKLNFLIHADQVIFWWISGFCTFVGGLIGGYVASTGKQAPEWGIMANCIFGFFAGFAVFEVLRRRHDLIAKQKHASDLLHSQFSEPAHLEDHKY